MFVSRVLIQAAQLKATMEQRISMQSLDPTAVEIPSFSGDLVEQLRAYARETKKRKFGELDDDSDTMHVREYSYNLDSDPNDREKTK